MKKAGNEPFPPDTAFDSLLNALITHKKTPSAIQKSESKTWVTEGEFNGVKQPALWEIHLNKVS